MGWSRWRDVWGATLAVLVATGCGSAGPQLVPGGETLGEPWATGRLAVATEGKKGTSHTLSILSLATNRTTVVSDDGDRFFFNLSWAGGNVVFNDFHDGFSRYQIYAVPPGGGPIQHIFPSPEDQLSYPAISRQGRVAYRHSFETAIDGQIVLPTSNFQSRTAWTPDGNHLLICTFSEPDRGALELYDVSVSPARFEATVLTAKKGDEFLSPIYSPDGSRIALTLFSHPGTPGTATETIWVVDADGSNLHQVTSGPLDHSPGWSPDGTRIAFCANQALNVISPDGSGLEKLLDGVHSFAWVP